MSAHPVTVGATWENAGVPRHYRGPFRDMPAEVAILTAVSFTVALGFGIVAPDIPAFARHFGVSTAAAASVVSAFALLRVLGALPAGRLVDRFGERRVMAAGITVVAASSILAGFSGSFAELIVLRGIGGLGSAMFSVSAQTLLLMSVPADQRGRASGLFSGGFLVGSISGPAIGGLLAAWSLRAPFFVYGGMLVVPAVIAAGVLRDPAPRGPGRGGPSAAEPGLRGGSVGEPGGRVGGRGGAQRHRAAVRPRRPAPVRGVDGYRISRGGRAERRGAPARRVGGRPAGAAAGHRGRLLGVSRRTGHAGRAAGAVGLPDRAGRTRAGIRAAGRGPGGDDRRPPGWPGRPGRHRGRHVPDGRGRGDRRRAGHGGVPRGHHLLRCRLRPGCRGSGRGRRSRVLRAGNSVAGPCRRARGRPYRPELRTVAASRRPIPGHLSGHDDIERARGPFSSGGTGGHEAAGGRGEGHGRGDQGRERGPEAGRPGRRSPGRGRGRAGEAAGRGDRGSTRRAEGDGGRRRPGVTTGTH